MPSLEEEILGVGDSDVREHRAKDSHNLILDLFVGECFDTKRVVALSRRDLSGIHIALITETKTYSYSDKHDTRVGKETLQVEALPNRIVASNSVCIDSEL